MLPSYVPVLLQRKALMEVHTVLSKIKEKRRPHVLNSAGNFSFMLLASLKSTIVVCFYKGPDDKLSHVLKCQNRMRCL
jgi:hypothetical protein